jgi:hypothetical protein
MRFVLALASLCLSGNAYALCGDDLAAVQKQITKLAISTAPAYQKPFLTKAKEEWNRAKTAQPGSETECLSHLSRAKGLLTQARSASSEAKPTVDRNAPGDRGGRAGAIMPLGSVSHDQIH